MTDRSTDAVPSPREALSSRTDLGTRDAVCPEHGEFVSKGFRLEAWKREIWSQCSQCQHAAEREQRDEERRRQADRVARERQEAIGQTCIPLRFQDRTFEAFHAADEVQLRALTVVRDFTEGFVTYASKGSGLILSGKPGTGKTHLASAAMLALMGSGRWVQYATCMGMIRMVRETWARKSERTEREVLRLLGSEIDLLVIDEVGVQYGTEGEQNIVFDVLDRRYAEMRPSILITNQDTEGLKASLGERTFDRLRQTHALVKFDWPSYRRTARKEGEAWTPLQTTRVRPPDSS
jgi:DNA replication protein DnaC